MSNASSVSRRRWAYAVCGAVLGAVVRYLSSSVWPIPPAFPAPPSFPAAGIASVAVTTAVALFVAGFTATAMRKGNLQAFVFGACAGAASLSHYAVIGVSTVAAAGLLVLLIAPVCGLVGFAAGVLSAVAVRARRSGVDHQAPAG